jgi:hypothetical protein
MVIPAQYGIRPSKAQAAQIQKVSDHVEARKPAPRLVADSQ